jgi:DNA-binding NarL/FixJ family response regulator
MVEKFPTMTINLLLVDDQPAVRQGLKMRLALEPDLKVVGEASDGLEALKYARALNPNVIVMDVEMPLMDGVAATEALRRLLPKCVVVLLTIHDDVYTRDKAREAGAAALVSKQAGDAELLKAIREAM